MNAFNRRIFLQGLGAAAVLAGGSAPLRAAAPARVVVIGGGFGGATAAKYLRHWGGDSVDVTLVDAQAAHFSCIMSNLVLNERLTLPQLRFGYQALANRYGVDFRRDTAREIDGPGQRILLDEGGWLGYDHLILSPGIAFEPIHGWNPWRVPHAWIAGVQTILLKRQIDAMPDGGTFVMTIPKAPFRCPPGPYERACTIADLLLRRGGPQPRVIVLDANPGIQAEAETFELAYSTIYDGVVDYRPNVELLAVDSLARTAVTSDGDVTGDVLNVIPTHKAASLVEGAGLTDGGPWAEVHPLTYESVLPGFPGVHVIGDSQGTGQPKSGSMANAEAKVCADAVLRQVAGLPLDAPDRVANIITNSACYSPITFDEASWLTAVFSYQAAPEDPWDGSMALVDGSLAEAGTWTRDNFRDMLGWWANLSTDTFR